MVSIVQLPEVLLAKFPNAEYSITTRSPINPTRCGKRAVMARSTPRVDGTVLVDMAGAASSITVGAPAWDAWLLGATTFAFRGAQSSFTARKERRGRAGWFWKAYRKHNGRLCQAYVGKSA